MQFMLHILFRLEEDLSESMDRDKSGKEKSKIRLKLNLPEKVTSSFFDPEPLLPKRILEDL